MSHIPRLTAIGLYNYDETLFDDLKLPEEINKEDFINTFLLEYGECPLLYTDLDFVKFTIKVFSKKWYSNIEKIITAITDEYNPLHNFDRIEKYSDIEKILEEKNTKSNSTSKTNDRNDGTIENTVSAYNATTYQPDTKQTNKNTNDINNTASGNINEDGETQRELDHEAHLYGNIGVTTSQQMLEAELKLRETQNLLHIVSELLYKEICIYTY